MLDKIFFSFNYGVFLPELNTLVVLLSVNINPTTAKLFAETVPHCCNGGHWKFVSNVLCFDRNDSILIINIFVGIFVSHTFVFNLNLLFAIKNNVQELCLSNSSFRHKRKIKPSAQNWQLLLISSLVPTS